MWLSQDIVCILLDVSDFFISLSFVIIYPLYKRGGVEKSHAQEVNEDGDGDENEWLNKRLILSEKHIHQSIVANILRCASQKSHCISLEHV